MIDWNWTDHALPGCIQSQVSRHKIDPLKHEFALVPTLRLPTLIHTRGSNAKWLYELSSTNPVWSGSGDLLQVFLARKLCDGSAGRVERMVTGGPGPPRSRTSERFELGFRGPGVRST